MTPRWWSRSRKASTSCGMGWMKEVVDGVVNGSAGTVAWISAHLRKLETGFVQTYALAILLGMVLIGGYLIGR